MSSVLMHWNDAPADEAVDALLGSCGSPLWVAGMVERRPFASFDELLGSAEHLWLELPEPEWLAAFSCHPRIGEQATLSSTGAAFANHSTLEQEAAHATLESVAGALQAGNRAYEERFGFLYLVLADGRPAPELLAILEARLLNDRAAELAEAARQQWLITRLRLNRWLRP